MKMNKISDRIYEFVNSSLEDNIFEYGDDELDFVEIKNEKNEVDYVEFIDNCKDPLIVMEFFSYLKIGLDNLSVEEAEKIGLI